MKNFTLRILFFTLAAFSATSLLQAQNVYVLSPESLFGSYDFGTAANFGAQLTDSVWIGETAFVSTGAEENPTNGCGADSMAIVNTDEVAGKIALIDRGACSFVEKCLNAQQAGAMGAIIFNNAPGAGAINMGGSSSEITIPCAFLSYEAGQSIRAELENGEVIIMMGDTTIRFANDLRVSTEDILVAPLGTIPVSQLTDDNPFVFVPGAVVNNVGDNNADNAEVKATIVYESFDGSEVQTVYQDSSSLVIVESDSSELITLSEFTPESGVGYYNVSYDVSSDSTDGADLDNAVSFDFAVTENSASKASWNAAADLPSLTSLYTVAGGGEVEFLTGINFPKGLGQQIDSVVFYVGTNAPSLAGIFVEAYIYEWNDANENGGYETDEVSIVAFGFSDFQEDETATQAWVTAPLLDFVELEETSVVIPEDDKTYLLGLRYRGSEVVFFGFDETLHYEQRTNLQTANGQYTDTDLPYIGINNWIDDITPDVSAGFIFTNVQGPTSAALIISQVETNTEELTLESFDLQMYPNPVSSELTMDIELKENSAYLIYEVLDASGKSVFMHRNTGVIKTDKAIFNVSQLPAGQYFLKVATDKGFTTQSFVVQR